MENVKRIVVWQPKTAKKKNPSGKIEPVGKFRTKVPQGTPNAVRYAGENEAKKKWDFWGVDVDSVNGVVRWVDIRTSDYGTSIVLFLETNTRLNQVEISLGGKGKTDAVVLRNVVNHLCGLKKELATAVVNLSYWVRPKVNSMGQPKLNKDNEPILAKTVMFGDVPEKYTFDEWRGFAQENGLEWVKEKRGLDDVWNNSAEVEFWIKQVAKIQRFLLGTPNVLPFCWNSVTASASDGTDATLTADEIEKTREVYERIKRQYQTPYARQSVMADDVALEPQDANDAAEPAAPFDTGFPTEPPPGNGYEVEVPAGDYEDDLPF